MLVPKFNIGLISLDYPFSVPTPYGFRFPEHDFRNGISVLVFLANVSVIVEISRNR